MSFMLRERQLVEGLMPGLLAKLDAIPFDKKESPGNETLEILRQASGPKLVIPKGFRGMESLDQYLQGQPFKYV